MKGANLANKRPNAFVEFFHRQTRTVGRHQYLYKIINQKPTRKTKRAEPSCRTVSGERATCNDKVFTDRESD